jgi:histidinol-phosphate/aromatic aminotransferase/cobyric acid decarboxylase-like protein
MPAFSRFTALAQSLPPTVPFVGPETQERARGAEFKARLGANESGFGAAPSVIEAIAREAERQLAIWRSGKSRSAHRARCILAFRPNGWWSAKASTVFWA